MTVGNIPMHIYVIHHCAQFAAHASLFCCNYMNHHGNRILLRNRKENQCINEVISFFQQEIISEVGLRCSAHICKV